MPAQRELLRGICNDGGVDEAVVCEIRVIILAEGAVCIIDHGDGGDGSAVRRNGREGKERLIELIGNILAGIAGAAAAHGKDHVGFLHERVCDKGIAVFVGGIAAIGEEAQKARRRSLLRLSAEPALLLPIAVSPPRTTAVLPKKRVTYGTSL